MDKRTLFFVISMTAALLVINTFFSYLDQQQNQEWVEKQKAKKEKLKKELVKDIQENTATFEEIPLTALFSDSKLTTMLSYGVQIQDIVLYIPEKKEIPNTIYDSDGVPFTLINSPEIPGTPALFAKNSDAKLDYKEIPSFGSFELQLVFANQKKTPPVSIYLGEYRNSFVTLPIDVLGEEFPEEYSSKVPSGSAIALVKMNGSFLPVGIYNAKEKNFIPLDDLTYLTSSLLTQKQPTEIEELDHEEQYFVLENEYQQLVFSNKGAALAEINLPFESPKNTFSVVREIEFDREMVQEDPQNAMFPSRGFYTPGTDGALTYNEKGQLGGYYPLIRRSLIEKPPYETIVIEPQYYALNIVSEYPELANLMYKVVSYNETSIVFEATQPHRKIRKSFSIAHNNPDTPYVIDVTIEIEGDTRGLWITSGIPEIEWINGAMAPALKYRVTKANGKSSVESISLPDPVITNSTQLDWTCNSNGFLGTIVDPLTQIDQGFKAEKVSGLIVPTRLVVIDQQFNRFNPEKLPGYQILLPLNSKGGAMKFRIFAGPFDTNILTTVDKTFSDPATGYNPDYISSQTTHGYFTFISQPFSKFLLVLLNWFHFFTGSWGISIILLTIALRIMIFPLSAWSFKSMRKMQEIAPEIKAIQEKYKGDTKKLNIEQANLYRDKKVNPLSGCLPLIIQLPFLIGMFDLLKSSFELRGAPFIPGWIDNLAAPDVVFSWGYPIFFIGTELHALPILMALAMVLQAKLGSTSPKNPAEMTDKEKQQKTMSMLIGAPFAILFYNAPSGLCIYWIFSTLFGIIQQKGTNYWYDLKTKKDTKTIPIQEKGTKKKKRKR